MDPQRTDTEPTPETIRFEPNSEAQLRFMRSRAPRLLLSSGYGKGKTRVLCEKFDTICRLYPGTVNVLARKTLASMWHTTIQVYEDEVMDEALKPRFNKSARGGPTVFYPNGSKLVFMPLEDVERAKSGQYANAGIDEADDCTEEMADAIAGRLRQRAMPWHQLAMTCNPRGRSHWIFREFRPDRGSRRVISEQPITLPSGERIPEGQLLRECVVSGPRDNVGNLPVDYQIFLSQLKGKQKLRYVDGLWVSFEGQVYDGWIDEAHRRRRPQEWIEKWGGFPPPTWRRYRSIDFGYENPFVCQWWTKQPDGPFWMYREIYKPHRLVRQHARRIKLLEREELRALRDAVFENPEEAKIDYWREKLRYLEMNASVMDPSALEPRMQLERSPFNIWTEPAETDVEGGIQTVSRLLSLDAEGMPGIVFVEGAVDEVDEDLDQAGKPTCSADEFPNYHYPEAKEGKAKKEEPVKEDDHGCDCAKNLFHTLEVSGELSFSRAAHRAANTRGHAEPKNLGS